MIRGGWLFIARCLTLSAALAFGARELSEWLMAAIPHHAGAIHKAVGLSLVLSLGFLVIRPAFLVYRDRDSEQE